MRVIANRQLRGTYGTVVPDQEFEVGNDLAAELLKAGLVRHALPPRVEYDTKVIVPKAPEVSARQSFRDLSVPDKKSETVAAEGDSMFPVAELSRDRTTDPRGRSRR